MIERLGRTWCWEVTLYWSKIFSFTTCFFKTFPNCCFFRSLIFIYYSSNYFIKIIITFFRDSTKLGQPAGGSRNVGIAPFCVTYTSADAASTPEYVHFQHHDSPSTTSQITYKITGNTNQASSTTLFVNRTITDSDSSAYERGMSFIMAQEIKV